MHLRPGTPEAEGEEMLAEVVARLSAVTQGADTQVRDTCTVTNDHINHYINKDKMMIANFMVIKH